MTTKRIPLFHPGELLQEEFLQPLQLSQSALANALSVPRSRINDIVRGKRPITADTALRLSIYFGNTPEFWLNLQTYYDLEYAKATHLKRLQQEVRPRRG